MADRYFTRDEADALLPQIAPLLQTLQGAWAELVEISTAAALLRQRMLGNGYALVGEMRDLMSREAAAQRQVADLVSAVRGYGCDLKDPATGLIDFPARLFGKEVLLCWRLGEDRIRFWHDLDAGFLGRQPLDSV